LYFNLQIPPSPLCLYPIILALMDFFRQSWWKWLTAALMMYVVIGGLTVPLGPGAAAVQPITFKPDTTYTFNIYGYNTHFKDAKGGRVQLWFKNGNDYYCPSKLEVVSNDLLKATFAVSSAQQDSFTRANFDVVINDDVDGTFALREGVTLIKSKEIDTASTVASVCVVEVSNNKHQLTCFPYREIIYETIRNTFYHVPMWFGMMALVTIALVCSILYLATNEMKYDIIASNAVNVALLYGILGLLTGMMWANYTWGEPWPNDPKLNGAAVGVMIYFAYIILRGSINDEIKRARIAAVYSVFGLIIFTLFIFVIPRLGGVDTLHPGQGGNPAFSKYDLDNTMRIFFYPAIIAWIMLGVWMMSIGIRLNYLENKDEA
jgi:heme exporter protein C